MRTLSFMTRYSPVYRGPVTEINIDNVPIALAIPMQPRNQDSDLEKEKSSVSTFAEQVMNELTKDEYDLSETELNAIVEYLTTHGELFKDFSYESVKKMHESA